MGFLRSRRLLFDNGQTSFSWSGPTFLWPRRCLFDIKERTLKIFSQALFYLFRERFLRSVAYLKNETQGHKLTTTLQKNKEYITTPTPTKKSRSRKHNHTTPNYSITLLIYIPFNIKRLQSILVSGVCFYCIYYKWAWYVGWGWGWVILKVIKSEGPSDRLRWYLWVNRGLTKVWKKSKSEKSRGTAPLLRE